MIYLATSQLCLAIIVFIANDRRSRRSARLLLAARLAPFQANISIDEQMSAYELSVSNRGTTPTVTGTYDWGRELE